MLPAHSRLHILLAIPLIAACQQGTDSLDVGQTNQEILGGTPLGVGQFPTVVASLIDSGQRGLCTGTLVAPDLVLTAAHCVDPRLAGFTTQEQVTQATVIVLDSSNLGQNGTTRAVVETARHQSFNNPGDPDVGIIRLAQPVTDREPTRVNFDPGKAPVGTTVTMVGYGISDNGQAGQGFVLSGRSSQSCGVNASDSLFLCFSQIDGKGKCQGDSGGPSFAMIDGVQTLVGITSFGDQNCQQLGADMRTDASRSFLATAAPDLLCAGGDGHCDSLCGTGGAPADPDCAAGCTTNDECSGEGQLCDTSAGTCYAGPGSPGGLGAPCGEGLTDCDSGICATFNGDQVCTETCETGNSSCPSGFDCVGIGDQGQGACFINDDEGGCNAGGGSGGAGALLVLLGLLALGRRRRED